MHAELEVQPEESGLALGTLLKQRGYSRRLVTRLKRTEGGITRDGVLLRTIDSVSAGDIIILSCPDSKLLEPACGLEVPVIFEDSELVVFNKPPAMPVHPSMKHRDDTLGNYFARIYPSLTFRPVNRLDRDTSGCVLAAKTQYAAARLQGSFGKEYLAVCCGHPDTLMIDAPIARERESLIKRCVREDGKPALTQLSIIQEHEGFTLCRVLPKTGRTHQIRVHFSYIGCPLAGDELYGGSRAHIARQALHCARLSFISPADGSLHTVEAPLPEDMKELLKNS